MTSDRKKHTILLLFLFTATVSGQQNPWQGQQLDGQNQDDSNCCEDYCYVRDEEPYLYFGTKTAYVSLNRRSGSQHIIPECTPVQFWSIIRHGTRLPKGTRIEELSGLNKLHEEVVRNYEQRRSYPDRGRLCREDYELFRRWRWNDTITPDKGNSLTNQGEDDMKLLARRYKSRYSELLRAYDERSYYFQYTNVDRTQASYQAYVEGLFGSEAYRVHANTITDDRLVKPYENCKTWTENVVENPDIRGEYNRFLEKPEYLQLVRDVFRRLGFRYNLNASVINDLYDVCRYEKAWNVLQRSPWCIAFTKNQLKLLEYAEDLKYYYKTGYGNKMSEKIGCAPVKDMYERFDKTVNGNSDGNKATFFFTHSATMQSVLTALGIGKDYTPLTADNYYQQTRRNWRTSTLDPFASNFVATLYQCRSNEKYRVMFFLNEEPVEFPDCSVGLCNWSTVQQKFQTLADSCNIDSFCNQNSATSNSISYFIYMLVAALILCFRA